jgi:hypothetical protein
MRITTSIFVALCLSAVGLGVAINCPADDVAAARSAPSWRRGVVDSRFDVSRQHGL